jgi:hypothetical protein
VFRDSVPGKFKNGPTEPNPRLLGWIKLENKTDRFNLRKSRQFQDNGLAFEGNHSGQLLSFA